MITRRGFIGVGIGAALAAPIGAARAITRAPAGQILTATDVHVSDYPTVEAVRWIGQQLEQETGGRLKLRLYHSGQLGREAEAGYLPSMRVLDRAEGYRTPSTLPDGSILVSYASNPATGNFGVYAFDPRTGARTQLVTGGGVHVDAQLVYRHPGRKLYDNRRQLVFGGRADAQLAASSEAIVHIPDAPMLFTLLTSNLRRGRPVDAFRAAHALELVTEGMCPAGPCSPNTGGIYESRQPIGRVPLAEDGSLRMRVPAQTGVVLRLVDANGATVVTMEEEHQFGPGETISMGVSEALFDAVCGGCHGSISGSELDVSITPDALTGASRSLSSSQAPVTPN